MLPHLTTEQMIEVDRLTIEKYGVTLMQMMENAGRNLAELARTHFLDNDLFGKRILILSGSGGNGGGGLVAARHCANRGALVQVILSQSPDKFTGVPKHQLSIVESLGIEVNLADENTSLTPADLLIDALIGYSLNGAPRGVARDLIIKTNASKTNVLSLDVPSGFDSIRGAVFNPVVTANATMTLALPKIGFQTAGAAAVTGDLFVADISIPHQLYQNELGLDVPHLFSKAVVARVDSEEDNSKTHWSV